MCIKPCLLFMGNTTSIVSALFRSLPIGLLGVILMLAAKDKTMAWALIAISMGLYLKPVARACGENALGESSKVLTLQLYVGLVFVAGALVFFVLGYTFQIPTNGEVIPISIMLLFGGSLILLIISWIRLWLAYVAGVLDKFKVEQDTWTWTFLDIIQVFRESLRLTRNWRHWQRDIWLAYFSFAYLWVATSVLAFYFTKDGALIWWFSFLVNAFIIFPIAHVYMVIAGQQLLENDMPAEPELQSDTGSVFPVTKRPCEACERITERVRTSYVSHDQGDALFDVWQPIYEYPGLDIAPWTPKNDIYFCSQCGQLWYLEYDSRDGCYSGITRVKDTSLTLFSTSASVDDMIMSINSGDLPRLMFYDRLFITMLKQGGFDLQLAADKLLSAALPVEVSYRQARYIFSLLLLISNVMRQRRLKANLKIKGLYFDFVTLEQAATKRRKADEIDAENAATERVLLKLALVKLLDRLALGNDRSAIEDLSSRYAPDSYQQWAFSMIALQSQTLDKFDEVKFLEACECLEQQFNQDSYRRFFTQENIDQLIGAKKRLVAVSRLKEYEHLRQSKERLTFLISKLNQLSRYDNQ